MTDKSSKKYGDCETLYVSPDDVSINIKISLDEAEKLKRFLEDILKDKDKWEKVKISVLKGGQALQVYGCRPK
jgi:hypothetical protein